MSTRITGLFAVVLVLFTACGPSTPSTGTLQVNITGLPAGVNASVNVSGTGFAQALTATSTLNDRAPGSYNVTASNVTSGAQSFFPSVSGNPATVRAGETSSVNVIYQLPGTLNISFKGLPADTSGNAVVTGPGGFNQTLTGPSSVSLKDLAPGQYTISSGPIRVKRTVVDPIFDPTNDSGNTTLTVKPDATIAHEVAYFQRTGTGALWIPSNAGFVKGYANAQLALNGAVDPLGSLPQTGVNEQAVFDKTGSMFVSNSTDNAIYSAIGGLPAIKGSNTKLNRPRGMAFDSAGNLWVTNGGSIIGAGSTSDDSVLAFTPTQLQAGGDQTPQIILTGSSFSNPVGAAFDAGGNLWVSNFGTDSDSSVIKLSPANLTATATITAAPAINGLNTATGLAFDSTGNLWVANLFATKVLKFTPAQQVTGGKLTADVTLSGFSTLPRGLAFDNGGNLWVLQEASLTQINAADLLTSATPTPARTITGFGGISVGLAAFSPTPSNLPIQNK